MPETMVDAYQFEIMMFYHDTQRFRRYRRHVGTDLADYKLNIWGQKVSNI